MRAAPVSNCIESKNLKEKQEKNNEEFLPRTSRTNTNKSFSLIFYTPRRKESATFTNSVLLFALFTFLGVLRVKKTQGFCVCRSTSFLYSFGRRNFLPLRVGMSIMVNLCGMG